MLPEETAGYTDVAGPSPVDGAVFDGLVAELGEPGGDFLSELITMYVEEGTAQCVELRRAATAGDGTAFAAIAHAWRSTSALIGASSLVTLLRQAEADAGQPSSELAALAEAIVADYDLVAAWLLHRRESP
jgi:HPt (histidine-containing phosphotransfer) domain-containing protein